MSVINHLLVTFHHDGKHILDLYFPPNNSDNNKRLNRKTHTTTKAANCQRFGNEGTLYLHTFILA